MPAARFRPWASALAVAAIAGIGVGLLRLLIGLWAIRLCRRRGTIVSDPCLITLCEKIRLELGCHQPVEIRDVPELTTPATAGWWRPVILLPDNWRSWADADCRAVLAHELAHIQRWDYAAGLAPAWRLHSSFITRSCTGWRGGSSCNRSWRRTRWRPVAGGRELYLCPCRAWP